MVDSGGREWKTQDELGTSGGFLKENRSQAAGLLMAKAVTI